MVVKVNENEGATMSRRFYPIVMLCVLAVSLSSGVASAESNPCSENVKTVFGGWNGLKRAQSRLAGAWRKGSSDRAINKAKGSEAKLSSNVSQSHLKLTQILDTGSTDAIVTALVSAENCQGLNGSVLDSAGGVFGHDNGCHKKIFTKARRGAKRVEAAKEKLTAAVAGFASKLPANYLEIVAAAEQSNEQLKKAVAAVAAANSSLQSAQATLEACVAAN